MRVRNQGYLAQVWADIDRHQRVIAARKAAGGTVCGNCLRPIRSEVNRSGEVNFYFHPDLQENADDAKNRLGIYCEGRMEAQPA